jgi:DNA-binding MarR family transcriptional regulator
VTLNIGAAQTDEASRQDAVERPDSDTIGAGPRPDLIRVALDELTSWSPREFIGAFHKWHQGAVSLVHLNVLALLDVHGPMSMSKLAEAMDISVASMTGVVDRMEKRGLVGRRHDTEDRRVVLVEIADGGRAIFSGIDDRRRQALGSILGRLTDEEMRGLVLGHRAMREARRAFVAEELARGEASTTETANGATADRNDGGEVPA